MSAISLLFTKLICLHLRGGVTAGGGDRMTGDSIALLSAALAGLMQVSDVMVCMMQKQMQGWY